MKQPLLKNTLLSLVCSTICFSMTTAYAEDVYLGGYYPIPDQPLTGFIKRTHVSYWAEPYNPEWNLKVFPTGKGSDVPPEFEEINKTHFGGALHMTDGRNSAWVTIPAVRKRDHVFTLMKKDESNKLVDIAPYKSVEDAKSLCDGLSQGLTATYRLYFYDSISGNSAYRSEYDYTSSPQVYVSDWAGGQNRVIAVPYFIAYDTGSKEQSSDGKSSSTLRYHFCENKWGWKPSPYWGGSNEDEFKGIRTSNLTDARYEVTCMDSKNYLPTTFWPSKETPGYWTNGKDAYGVIANKLTEHQLNKQVGAKYCPVS